MEPSFWSWEKDQLDVTDLGRGRAAMEPSFWSWEKPSKSKPTSSRILGRNGAQLLELGKAPLRSLAHLQDLRRNGAQLLELGKAAGCVLGCDLGSQAAMEPSFWSWEKPEEMTEPFEATGRNGAQLLELGKELAIFSPTDYQCCTSLRAAEVLGQTSRVVAP